MGKEEYGPPPAGDPKPNVPSGFVTPTPAAPPVFPGVAAPHVPAPPAPPHHAAALPASSHPSVPFAAGGRAGTSKNWMGLTALIAGVLGITPLAIAAGVGGIRAAKDGRATNRMLAIVGIVAGAVTPFPYLYVASNIGDSWRETHGEHVALEDLKAGDCVRKPGGADEAGSEVELTYLTVIACNNAHWGQVYYVDDIKGSTFPTGAEMDAATVEICESDDAIAHVKPSFLSSMYWGSVVPTPELWPDSHAVICILEPYSGNLNQDWVVQP